ncbi:hypothetical protein SAMN05421640_1412 [Ekhidna lutea]|uniref:Tetracyclin repressor-like C-terminal domain-containing protein n=1 Tax=Ekhidna lutea TaxID=447679 RepID=A0A239HN85_EKHLU|nr:hypothetical protein [Ekhidna lutea]SNS82846.1 hypothetical protein SAMN05421640_1412 [Ekhidna lutea]
MAKKNTSKSSIQKGYMNYLLEEGKAPETVRIFTNFLKITDDDFYKYFGSLKGIEASVWEGYYSNTFKIVLNDPDFEEMNAREKHLSFLYTFLELIKPDRSYVLFKLEGKKPHELPQELTKTQKIVTQSEIDWAKTFDFIPDKAKNISQSAYKRMLWSHTIATLFFWVKDDSANSTDTDIFIEKSTRTAFDIGELPALESIVDLSKFFLQKMGLSKTTA